MKTTPLLALALAALACGPSERELAVVAERDSLLADVLEQATLINEINLELAAVADTSAGLTLPTESGLQQAADKNRVTLARIRDLIARLQTQEEELRVRRDRIQSLSTTETRLLIQVREYEETVTEIRTRAEAREAEYAAMIEQQRSMIVALNTQLDSARDENQTLLATNVGLSTEVDDLTAQNHTVYYVVGTKQELKDRGIIVEEGSKFLIFGSRTVQPARNLNPDDFTAINMTEVVQIPLPRTDKSYRILTRHNPDYLESPLDDGKVRGDQLTIIEPAGFWAPSRFLILVQS